MTTANSRTDTSTRVARALLNSGCVQMRSDEPFRLPSGWATPVYMDCRRLISFPSLRREVIYHGLAELRSIGCLENVKGITGAESSGIAFAAWIAEALNLPLQYVRKKARSQNWIEGVVAPGDRLLLVDDLMAAGHSKAKFCNALTAAGAQVKDIFVVFDYGTFPTQSLLGPLGVTVHSLATWEDILRLLREDGRADRVALVELEDFLSDPASWSEAHGGVGSSPLNVV